VSRAPVTLVLVPTELEARRLALRHTPLELCGFGLARAGVGAMQAIARYRPQRLVLAGVAGSYDADLAPIGAVLVPGLVRCHGIGAGDQTPADLGFADSDEAALDGQDGLALSVARASQSLDQARSRHVAEPRAVLEEMEGYSVALAAMIAEIPCTMVRAISNMAGDRDLAGWSLDPALDALRERLDSMLAS
jgi:futalosine hydrolase